MNMQIAIKDCLLAMLSAAIAIALSRLSVEIGRTAALPARYSYLMHVALIASGGCWGGALGVLLRCPWRGFLIGVISVFAALFGYFANGGA
jgi:uncharacterized membrane protein